MLGADPDSDRVRPHISPKLAPAQVLAMEYLHMSPVNSFAYTLPVPAVHAVPLVSQVEVTYLLKARDHILSVSNVRCD